MTDDPHKTPSFSGASLDHWGRVFAPGMTEFGASNYSFVQEGGGFLRIAFGNAGPFTDSEGGRRSPVFTHAVILPTDMAITLAQDIIRMYASVKTTGT